MLIPIWSATHFQNGQTPYGIFLSRCIFPYRGSPYGYGDWCFCLPLSHACTGPPPKILAKKPKFSCLAHPAQPNAVVALLRRSRSQLCHNLRCGPASLFPFGDFPCCNALFLGKTLACCKQPEAENNTFFRCCHVQSH
jgi:hypothetical protein